MGSERKELLTKTTKTVLNKICRMVDSTPKVPHVLFYTTETEIGIVVEDSGKSSVVMARENVLEACLSASRYIAAWKEINGECLPLPCFSHNDLLVELSYLFNTWEYSKLTRFPCYPIGETGLFVIGITHEEALGVPVETEANIILEATLPLRYTFIDHGVFRSETLLVPYSYSKLEKARGTRIGTFSIDKYMYRNGFSQLLVVGQKNAVDAFRALPTEERAKTLAQAAYCAAIVAVTLGIQCSFMTEATFVTHTPTNMKGYHLPFATLLGMILETMDVPFLTHHEYPMRFYGFAAKENKTELYVEKKSDDQIPLLYKYTYNRKVFSHELGEPTLCIRNTKDMSTLIVQCGFASVVKQRCNTAGSRKTTIVIHADKFSVLDVPGTVPELDLPPRVAPLLHVMLVVAADDLKRIEKQDGLRESPFLVSYKPANIMLHVRAGDDNEQVYAATLTYGFISVNHNNQDHTSVLVCGGTDSIENLSLLVKNVFNLAGVAEGSLADRVLRERTVITEILKAIESMSTPIKRSGNTET